MTRAASYRGQPLVAFLLIIGGWVAMRVMAWDSGTPEAIAPSPTELVLQSDEASAPLPVAAVVADGQALAFARPIMPTASFRTLGYRRAPVAPAARVAARPTRASAGWLAAAAPPRGTVTAAVTLQPKAGLPSAFMPAPPPRPEAGDARWSADSWLLLRRGGATVLPSGLAPPSYGASQAGAVLRYRLAPQSAHRPALYMRVSGALNGMREREAAFGLSARPIARVPIAFAAEARVNSLPGRTRLRPAAFAYTELPPVALPLRARAEVYGQAGYVGGNFASAFADGQLRVDRAVARVGRGELRAGGGAWGGAQKGASRLDVGPAATLGMPLGETAAARLAVDWRFRVAGNAAPSSGPALTLSAGF